MTYKHFLESDGHYLCNKACGITESKSTNVESEVTCKNCLRALKELNNRRLGALGGVNPYHHAFNQSPEQSEGVGAVVRNSTPSGDAQTQQATSKQDTIFFEKPVENFPLVSCIIAVLNEQEHIANCLVSIQNQDYPIDKLEIIIVDNGSTDATMDILNVFRKIKVLENKQLQSAGMSRNIGAEYSKGSILLFLDADEVICEGYIEALITPILKGKCEATAPKIETEKGTDTFKKGIFRAITREKFKSLGGFDISKGYGDDIVDGIKVKQVNVPLYQIRTDTLKKQYFKGKWIGNSFHYTGKDTWLGKLLYRIGFFKGITERKYNKLQ